MGELIKSFESRSVDQTPGRTPVSDDERHQRQAPNKDTEIAEVDPLCHFQERADG